VLESDSSPLANRPIVPDSICRTPNVALLAKMRTAGTKCGMIGADVRPNWSERPPPESLTGKQWR
jgi:hypothetical protein